MPLKIKDFLEEGRFFRTFHNASSFDFFKKPIAISAFFGQLFNGKAPSHFEQLENS